MKKAVSFCACRSVGYPVKISRLIDLIIKAECWVAGVGFLLLAILAILAVIKHQWLQVGVFALFAGIGIILLFLSANIQVWIESELPVESSTQS